MKITKILSILSIVFCCIYIISAFTLAIFPKDMCILFGMEKFLRISPDYILHSITSELTKEAYEINPAYTRKSDSYNRFLPYSCNCIIIIGDV